MLLATARKPRTLRAALLSSCLSLTLLTGAGFVHAQSPAERSSLILSNLPKSGSRAYRDLKAAAGQAQGERLEMTNSEMWSIPKENLEALKIVAATKGVEVMLLDSTWNTALSHMDDKSGMSAEQKDMMQKSMESKATMGISMMSLPDAKALEYALTQGMHSEAHGSSPAKLVIPLTDTLTVTAVRTSIEKTSDGYIWRGVVNGTDDAVTLMWWPAGRLTGQISYQGHVYAVRHMGGAMHGVVEMAPKGLPPEHAPMDPQMMKKMDMKEDPLVTKGDAGMLRDHATGPDGPIGSTSRPDRGETKDLEDASLAPGLKSGLGRGSLTAPPRSDATGEPAGAKPVEITLLVAYTKAARSHYSDIEKDLIELAVAETNQSFRASGIGQVRLRLVHAYRTGYVEKGSHFEHVFAFADKGDGKMDEVHRLRDKYKADVALLVVHDPNGCGLAAGVAPAAHRAFAVVHHECAALSYSLAHEIGHIIGARHDLELDDSTHPFPFGHGFVNGTAWRTMMSYEESCGGCPRLPIWSNPDIEVRGVAAGNEMANNARAIREGAARVAAFR